MQSCNKEIKREKLHRSLYFVSVGLSGRRRRLSERSNDTATLWYLWITLQNSACDADDIRMQRNAHWTVHACRNRIRNYVQCMFSDWIGVRVANSPNQQWQWVVTSCWEATQTTTHFVESFIERENDVSCLPFRCLVSYGCGCKGVFSGAQLLGHLRCLINGTTRIIQLNRIPLFESIPVQGFPVESRLQFRVTLRRPWSNCRKCTWNRRTDIGK